MTWRTDNLTATAVTNINLGSSDVYEVIEVDYPNSGATKYYSTREVTIGGQAYSPRVIEFSKLTEELFSVSERDLGDSESVPFPAPYLEITIDDSLRHGSDRLGSVFPLTNPEGCLVRKYTWIDANGAGTADRIPDGIFKIYDYDEPEPYKLIIRCVGIWQGIEQRKLGRVIEKIGDYNMQDSSIDIPDASCGKIVPIVFGRCKKIPLIALNDGASSQLAKPIYETTGIGELIYIQTQDIGDFPLSGKVQIGSETITYSGKDAGLGALVISAARETPQYHSANALCAEVPRYKLDGDGADIYGWLYAVADHLIKAVNTVYINGRKIAAAKWSLINYNAANQIVYKNQAIAAIAFPNLPLISSASHNSFQALQVLGTNGYAEADDWWTDASGNISSVLWQYAFSSDGGAGCLMQINEQYNATLRAQFEGDLSDGERRYGFIHRVYIHIEYAATKTFYLSANTDNDGNYVYADIEKNGVKLIGAPPPRDSKAMLRGPADEDIDITGLDHDHAFQFLSAYLEDYESDPTDESMDIAAYETNYQWGHEVTQRWSGYVAFHGEVWATVTYRLWDGDINTIPSTACMPIDYEIAGLSPTTASLYTPMPCILNAPDHDAATTYEYVKVTFSAYCDDIFGFGNSIWSSFLIEFYIEGSLVHSDYRYTDETNRDYTVIYEPDTPLTQAQMETLKVYIYPKGFGGAAETADYISGVSFYTRRVGTAPEIEIEGAIDLRELEGQKLSGRITKKIDMTDELTAWSDSTGVDIWQYFSNNKGGKPIVQVQASGQDAANTIVVYNLGFEIEYEPHISFDQNVQVTADVDGLCNEAQTIIYEDPVTLINLLLTNYSAVGFEGFGFNAIDGSIVDSDSMSSVYAQLVTAGYQYIFARALYRQESIARLIAQICRESRIFLLNELNKFVFRFIPDTFDAGSETIAKTDIFTKLIRHRRQGVESLCNKANVFFNRDWTKDGSEPEEIYRNVLTEDNAYSQSQPWGVQEKDIELLWHNNPTAGGGGTANFAEYIMARYAMKLMRGEIEVGTKGLRYSLGDVVNITQPYAGLDATPAMLISRERIASHRVILGYEFMPGEIVVWSESDAKIVIRGKYMYFIVEGNLVAYMDGGGNLFLSSFLREYQPLWPTLNTAIELYGGDRIYFAYDSGLGHYETRCGLYGGNWDELGGSYGARLDCGDFVENADLSGYSMAGTDYYESDTDSFRLSIDKSTPLLVLDASDDKTRIAGNIYENVEF